MINHNSYFMDYEECHMYNQSSKNICLLDDIRLKNGKDKLKAAYYEIVDTDVYRAIDLINDEKLQFPSLFILQGEISKFDLYPSLSLRNKLAIDISNDILARRDSEARFITSSNREDMYSILKWILNTGYLDDGLNDRYDEVIETAAILLVKEYGDKDCFNQIESLIFDRHRKGFFIYDLVWAYFETCASDNLSGLIERLRSPIWKDVELSRKLLNFIPCIGSNASSEPATQYESAVKWFNQNKDFLNYTGESFLQTSTPCRYTVSLESKYLHETIPVSIKETSRSISQDKHALLKNFRELDDESKSLLSNY